MKALSEVPRQEKCEEVRQAEQMKRANRHRQRWTVAPYLFLLPGIVLIAIWVYYPFLQTFWLSLFNANLAGGAVRFVGLQNYRVIIHLPEFRQALGNTVISIAGVSICAIIVPLFVALLLVRIGLRMQRLYLRLLFLPTMLAPVVVSLIWLWLLNPIQGVFSQWLLQLFGWHLLDLFTTPATAIWTIIGITSWHMFGVSLLLIFSVLVEIHRQYFDAARTDGASEWDIFRCITFPLLTPLLSFLLLYTALFAGQWAFGPVSMLTQGGPDNTTTNVYYLLYQFGFEFFSAGKASALAVLLFLLLGSGAFVEIYVLDRRVHYEN